ncbi:hypothetical protein HAX54_022862 [Datura stramonium]|uniref:Uncharacterized protein n=1 Tax=Datura stramonium TaxID=4076 RepID=A0ABS8UXK8_DATST|nr:hypothetical protein [Datura stramonium]
MPSLQEIEARFPWVMQIQTVGNGEDRNSGFVTSSVEDDYLEINKTSPVLNLMSREKSKDKFLKVLDFCLYEYTKDNAAQGSVIGTTEFNFGEYGVIRETLAISVPLNCKKSSKSLLQPSLYVKLLGLHHPNNVKVLRASPSRLEKHLTPGLRVQSDFQEEAASGTSKSEENTQHAKEKYIDRLISKITSSHMHIQAAIEVSLYSVVAGTRIRRTRFTPQPGALLDFISTLGEQNPTNRQVLLELLFLDCFGSKHVDDVPRLTFWLSNSIMLRAIISQAAAGQQFNEGGPTETTVNRGKSALEKIYMQQNIKYIANQGNKNYLVKQSYNWEDIESFTQALEKLEGWIFSKITKSLWWQTLAPHMQFVMQKLGKLSVKLWKRALKDACERLCPLRATGHKCGCLPVLPKLLVSRLDVAMFNIFFVNHEKKMPTDPLFDPISDHGVLPIPAGKSSFGAGAQLKNAVGSWSGWLTDLIGFEDEDSQNELPSDPIPKNVLEALDSEEVPGEYHTSFPCTATWMVYTPPPALSLTTFIEGWKSSSKSTGSSVLKKTYTSDVELDELDYLAFTSFLADSFKDYPNLAKPQECCQIPASP